MTDIPTPRTDAMEGPAWCTAEVDDVALIVPAEFARQLERELAKLETLRKIAEEDALQWKNLLEVTKQLHAIRGDKP